MTPRSARLPVLAKAATDAASIAATNALFPAARAAFFLSLFDFFGIVLKESVVQGLRKRGAGGLDDAGRTALPLF